MVAVGKVQTRDIHTCINHINELLNLIAGWAKGADDLCSAKLGVDGLKDVGELNASRVFGGLLFHLYSVC
jgi:hypothetical protein